MGIPGVSTPELVSMVSVGVPETVMDPAGPVSVDAAGPVSVDAAGPGSMGIPGPASVVPWASQDGCP